MLQVTQYLGDIEPFLNENTDISLATRAKLLSFFSDPNKKVLLQIELAAVIDFGEPFVRATYRLEGDGALVFQCYEVIDTVRASIQAANMPNLLAIATKLSGGVANSRQLMVDHGCCCIQPGIDYFNRQLTSTLHRLLTAFKAARYFSPHKMCDMQPSASCIASLKAFPFFEEEEIERLKSELPVYLAKATDVDTSIDPLHWWRRLYPTGQQVLVKYC